ncbi:MAG: L-serine ammonia-lyase, iron-sulfur-dependent, subunit alpha [Thermoflexaceae bacterium]|nr:L-serine ammonia-lyase, iron-sulfur-dependent, subunit alpha [Thermoflexaceae bacterium]
MKKDTIKYQTYVNILKNELVPAMGCTEPIALAFAAAKAREVLGNIPDHVLVQVSGSILKNVKSVIVPNTNHLKGIPAAVVAGIISGRPEKELEVLADISENERQKMNDYLSNITIETEHIERNHVFDIIITEFYKESYARIRITDNHTNIVLIEKNNRILYEKETSSDDGNTTASLDYSLLNMEDIWDFANSFDINDLQAVLERQIQYNNAISEEGLLGNYGANIGSILLGTYGNDVKTRAKAKAAAGSDARMNGCELPVIINSGSGNQGIACSVPVIEYAKELQSQKEKLYRALVLSNLTAIHEKTGIGTLSAYCGAVSAGAGAGAGIAYLCGGNFEAISHTIVNALAIVSGIICDGAKASCAAKISASVDAGILGYQMYLNGQEFKGGDGIVMNDIESTIKSIGRLGKDGMRSTNEEIIRLMME